MHKVIYSSCRLFLAATAFTMVFLFTPRVWVGDQVESHSRTIPVDRLEQSDTCLWCNSDRTVPTDDCRDRAEDDEHLWLNPDDPQPNRESDACDDQPESDPNA